ncbi:MAG: Hsp33 family molecular chaperone HslO [Pseudomonadota bacterium]
MPDSLQRFIFEHAPVRGEIVHLEATLGAVLEHRDYPPALRDALGELLAAAALLAATLKFSGSLVMQMHGSGVVKLIVVECTSDFLLRATAKWEGEPHGTLRQLLGHGRCAITLVPSDGGQSYQGVVALEGDSIAAMLQHYMQSSEQLDTRLWLATDRRRAAGMLLQKLPGKSTGKDEDTWARAQQLAATITAQELLQLPARQVIHRLYPQEDIRLLAEQAPAFGCSCSHERVATMLRMLGIEETRQILAEHGSIGVNCEFCNQHYVFDAEEVARVFGENAEHPHTRH